MPVVGSTAYANARAVTDLVRALLNDKGTLSIPVLIQNIVRNPATGVVTVTTVLPHNLLPGDFAVIANVPTGTSNFNGTFAVITSAPNVLQFTYNQAGVADSQGSGQVQGYGIGAKYTDTILMPFVNASYQMLGRELENLSSPTFIMETELVVPAVTTIDPSVQVVINDATAPPNNLPVNLLAPLKIWERTNGSSDEFVPMTNLTDGGGLPSREQSQILESWEWRSDGLYFIGATVDTQIRVRFMAYFADLTDGTSTILMRNMREAIAFPAAIMAGKSKGAVVPAEYTQLGETALEQVLNAAARQMQRKNYRMRNYSRRKGFGISY
jgi:hypothetical protein